MSRPAGGLLWLVYSGVCPSRFLSQTYLSLGGGVWRAHIWYVWATVECTDMLIQARVLSIARVCVIAIYSTLAGTWAVEYSAAEHMASFV